jgi:hypothetical protein
MSLPESGCVPAEASVATVQKARTSDPTDLITGTC